MQHRFLTLKLRSELMAAYQIPETAEGRLKDLTENIDIYTSNYEEFKEK